MLLLLITISDFFSKEESIKFDKYQDKIKLASNVLVIHYWDKKTLSLFAKVSKRIKRMKKDDPELIRVKARSKSRLQDRSEVIDLKDMLRNKKFSLALKRSIDDETMGV